MSNKNNRWSALSMKERADLINMYITNGISDIKEMKKHYNSFSGEEPIYGGELEAAVVKPNPVNAVLRTYYPIISEYPATGHSELQFFENHPTRPEIPVYLNRPITRGGSNYDYNLITNNCSDATRCAVENITKKKINPFLFTTPGDVKDFVIDNIEGSYNTPMKDGVISTYFQVPFADAMDAMNNQLDYEIENVKNNNKIPKKRKEEIIKGIENKKYVFQLFKYSNGGRILSGEEEHPVEVRQGLQNGTIKAIKKDDGTYAYVRQEKPIEDLTQSIAEWTAAGDLMDAAVAIDTVRKGDLKQAALLAGLAFVPNGLEKVAKLISRPIKNAKKISRMKEMYTGVPHRVTSNDPHISMDDSFHTYNGTIWTTDSPYLAKHYAEDTGKVFKVLTDPSELHILETPKPVKGEYFPWAHLPYTYDSGIKITDSELIDSGILPSIEEGLKFKKAVLSNSNSDKNVELIKNQKFLKGRIGGGKTDNIVENAYIDGFDGVNFYGVYDGPHLKDGYYIDTPTNETVLNPHTPHIVLPENKSKWSLLFSDLDKKTVLKCGGKILTRNKK